MKPTPKIGKWMILLHIIGITTLTASVITIALEGNFGAVIIFLVMDVLVMWSFLKGMKWL